MTRFRSLIAATALSAAAALIPLTDALAQVTYHRGNTGEPETLDQHRTSTIYESNILRDLYEGLVIYDPAANVIPGVAETWDISDDGTVYTFHLRENARWSNGDPVTAEDFVYSLRRILNPATGAKYANILYPILNAEAVFNGEMEGTDLGVEAIDERTLQITLGTATPYFLELLTHQTGLPVHPASVEEFGDDFVRPGNMVSNGAYMLVEQVPQAHILLEKNPHFHSADTVAIDRVYFYPTEDRSAALRRFQAGELHSNNDVPQEQVAWLRENLPDEFRAAPYLGNYYYAIRADKEPWSDVRVRRALSLALDREYIVEEITGAGEIAAYSFVPPGIGNYGEPAYADYRDTPMLDREDEAIRLMTEAGYGPDNPITMELRYNTSENHRRIAVAIADMWAPLGIEVTLFNTDVATHYAHLRDGGDFDVARAGWIGDYNDPQNFLFLVECDNTGFNYAHFCNEEYDRLMDEAAQTIDLDARAELLYQAEQIFMEELPYLPIYYYVSLNLVSTKVQGWEDNIQNVHATRFLSLAD
ncbi:MAG: peptide ABC transporter substrate-binding protein [Rhodospirillaceae bacterium]|nr:peptide ABC transporter substrate-binding protein [Rhodospirillaceae bacterium]